MIINPNGQDNAKKPEPAPAPEPKKPAAKKPAKKE